MQIKTVDGDREVAIDRLNDIDDPKASEYAYYDAKKRICKHSK